MGGCLSAFVLYFFLSFHTFLKACLFSISACMYINIDNACVKCSSCREPVTVTAKAAGEYSEGLLDGDSFISFVFFQA